MLGAIIGDIVGSRFEWNNIKTKEFELLNHKCFFTDDTVMSLAIAAAIINSKSDYSDLSQKTVEYMLADFIIGCLATTLNRITVLVMALQWE